MIQNYHIMNIKGYKSILSLAACTLLGTSVYAQSWKQEAVNCLNNGEFAKVEQIIGSLKKKEKKQDILLEFLILLIALKNMEEATEEINIIEKLP